MGQRVQSALSMYDHAVMIIIIPILKLIIMTIIMKIQIIIIVVLTTLTVHANSVVGAC